MLYRCQCKILFLTLLAMLSACRPDIRANVLHMGDSIMANSAEEIQFQETLRSSAVLSIFNAISGIELSAHESYWLARVTNIKEQVRLDAIFISLGTNDTNVDLADMPSQLELQANIEALLGAIGAETLVFWVPPHSSVATSLHVSTQWQRFIDALYAVESSGIWPNLTVLNLDQWFESQEKDIAEMVQPDGVHLNEQGTSAFVSMIVSAIETAFPVES